ncbi:MAG: glycosyl transferase family protein [Bradyrhizobium sp.]|nr:glycosyl transferase family protein [Bradyrhizobium sp.]
MRNGISGFCGDAPQRIVVFRALQLGDMLCAVPALRALRRACPEANITLAGLPWAESFAARFRHYIDDFVAFPGAAGFPEAQQEGKSSEAFEVFLAEMRRRKFDLALQLHGSGTYSNALVARFRAARMAGATASHVVAPECKTYPGDSFTRWPERGSEVRRCLHLISHLGIPARDENLEMPILPREREAAARLRRRHGLERGAYICIHPGARMLSRRWPLDRYAELGRMLAEDGFDIVLTGADGESELVQGLARAIPGAIPLAGETSLGELAALIGDSALMVCNDTGVSHVAAAVRAPSVVIACGSDTDRWAPLNVDLHRVLAVDVPCRPCMHQVCPIGHPCARAIEPAVVREAAFSQTSRYGFANHVNVPGAAPHVA